MILLAIPPTIIMLLNFGIKFLITPIFVEIFEPPIIQAIGFLISVVIFFSAFISVSNCNPAKDGKKRAWLYRNGVVESEKLVDENYKMFLMWNEKQRKQFDLL